MIKFTINVPPVTKKNHGQIIYNKKTGKPMMIPSPQYIQYEKDCGWFMPNVATIEEPVNIKAVFYMPTKRKCDLSNLLQALLDILVKYEVLADDNYTVVHSFDGSYVDYDKKRPRTEVYICPIKE